MRWDGWGLLRRWYLILPVGVILVGVLVPFLYLLVRATQAEAVTLFELVFNRRNLILLIKTIGLMGGVLVVTSLFALPMAWLTTRTTMRGRWILTVLGVLPLAVPGYVMAYVLLASTGEYGTLARTFGLFVPRLDGYDGALLALSLTTYPYLFLNLRTSLLGMDRRLEESAQSLGSRPFEVFHRVILPQLKPGFLAGGLLVGLHVLGDFGVVSLMRFDTYSYALYLQYTASYDRIYAACLALILLALTLMVLIVEAYFLKGLVIHTGRESDSRETRRYDIGAWKWPGYAFGAILGLVSVGLPLATVGEWMVQDVGVPIGWGELLVALRHSFTASFPAALLASLLAVPVAYLGVRHESTWSQMLERVAYLGYATPRLAFALAWIVFVLAVFPVGYQTLALLVMAYALHFMAEAIGPIRSSFYQISPSVEEAARSLGSGSLKLFVRVLFPLLKRGLLVAVAFVFLSAMKELPLTLLLSPPGFHTLATNTWSYAEEAMFASAAPYAMTIMLFSTCFVGLLLSNE